MSDGLIFLKLGGSLITVKDQPHTPRPEVLERLALEIAEALAESPSLQILLGHGSGSFGHVPADHYHTRNGVSTQKEWEGFSEVWRQAAELNHLVMAALEQARLPVIAFPPSASAIAHEGKVTVWDIEPLREALDKGLIPVIYGDVAFDQARGGTILSTEELFGYLALELKPSRVLFAGHEEGVWADFPERSELLREITPSSLPEVQVGLAGSSATDVTGGMLEKVRQVAAWVAAVPGLQGLIFSGECPGNVRKALLGEAPGTQIHAG